MNLWPGKRGLSGGLWEEGLALMVTTGALTTNPTKANTAVTQEHSANSHPCGGRHVGVARRTRADLDTLWVIEGVATYGARLARAAADAGYCVVEAAKMNTCANRGVGKSNPSTRATPRKRSCRFRTTNCVCHAPRPRSVSSEVAREGWVCLSLVIAVKLAIPSSGDPWDERADVEYVINSVAQRTWFLEIDDSSTEDDVDE